MSDSSRSLKILKITDVFLPKIEQTAMNEWTISGKETMDVSDGYHYMNELYEHRMALNVALCHSILVVIGSNLKIVTEIQVYKSKLHNDGTMFDGYFIVVIMFRGEQISYHYNLKYWDLFKIPEIERIPWEYDGHTSKEVIERLLKL